MMHHSRVEAEVGDRRVNGAGAGGGGGGGGGVHESRDAAELSGVRSRLASLRISSSSPDDNVVVVASSSNAAAGPGLHHNQQQQQQQRLSSYGIEEEFVEYAHKTIKKTSSNDHSYHSISDGEILGTYLRNRLEKKQQQQQHTSYGEEPEEQEQEQAQHSNVGARNLRSSSNGNGAAAVAPQRHLLSSSTLLGLEKLSKSGGGLVIHERTERRNGSRQKRNNSGKNNGGDLKTTLQQQREERKLHSARSPGELLSAGVRQSVQEIAERSSRRSRQQQQILINSSLRILDHDGDVSSSEQLQQHKQIHSSGIHQGDHEKQDDNHSNSGSEGERGLIYERNHHHKNHHHQQQQQQQQQTASNEGVYHQPRQTPPQTQMLQNYQSRHEIEEKDSSSSSSGGHGDHHHSMPAELYSSNKFLRRESKNQSWFAATELQSNLLVEVADSHFYLHKFPLLSRSGRLNRLVFESRDTNKYHIKLDGMPGGAEAFELAAKFCYGMEIELTPYNVATLRCGAEYLEMTNSLEDGNLVSKTEHYLNFVVLASWKDSITVLQRCQSLSPWAEDLQITRRCSEAIAWKACTDPHGITTHWSFSSSNDGTSNNSSSTRAANWDGIKNNNNNNDSSNTPTVVGKHIPHDWWIEDVVCNLDLFETFSIVMTAIKAKGMAYTLVGAAISQYAYKWLPGLARKPKRKGGGIGGGESFITTTDHHHNTAAVDVTRPQHNSGNNNNISQNHITTGKEIVLVHHDEDHQHTRHMRLITQMQQDAARQMVEGIVRMLPPQQDAVSCNFLLQLLQFACQLDVGLTCRTELERRIGLQLEQASVHDLLIPLSSSSSSSSSSPAHNNITSTQGYSYDIDIVQRIFNHFLLKEQTGLRNNSPTRSNIVGVEKNSHVFEGGGGSLVPNKLPPTTPHTTKTRVAKLMNSYLTEVARDPNLPLAKFQALAGSLPKFPYASDDGLYRAIDTYLKMHPTMTEHERKKLCRVMDCQRLSLDACLHAAQNERLPLRVVVQVLFSEQVKLRNAITGNSSLERKTQHHHHHIDVGSPSVHEPSSSQAGSNPHILVPRLDGLNMGRVSLEESWQSARSEIKALHHEIATLKSKFSELEHEHYTGMSQQMEKPKKLRNQSASGGWTSGWRILSSHIKAAPVASNTTSKQGSGHPSRDDYSSAPTFVASTFTGHNSSATTTTTTAIERRRSHSIASTVSAKGWRNSIS